MQTSKLHFVFVLLCFTASANAQPPNHDSSNVRRSSKPKNDSTKSNFLTSLRNNLAADKKRRDSLDKYYHEHPAEVNKYVQTQLVEQRVVPTNDAIDLIKAMNPRIRNLAEVNFYAELRMPRFEKLKRTDKKRLKKERKLLLKYDPNLQRQLVTKLDACQNTLVKIQNIKLQSSGNISPAAFDNSLENAFKQLQHYKNQNLKKGEALFLMQQADFLNNIMNDVIAKRRAERGHMDAVNHLYKAVSFSNPFKRSNNKEVSYEETQVYVKTSSSPNQGSISTPFDLTSFETEENVLCYIYAKKASSSGKDDDMKNQYFFSYQPFGNATYNCRTGNCIGFTENQHLVSVNGVNIIPSDYVFCFRDKDTGKLYYRCIDKDKFELITNSGNAGDRKKWKILFNPDSRECVDFLNW